MARSNIPASRWSYELRLIVQKLVGFRECGYPAGEKPATIKFYNVFILILLHISTCVRDPINLFEMYKENLNGI